MKNSLCVYGARDGVGALPFGKGPDGKRKLSFQAGEGIYQFSVIVRPESFDWERLYTKLELFNNSGQRTGPWDFDLLNRNEPLVPTYGVSLDGEDLGLWYMQRISLEDLEAGLFRGRTAFYISRGGMHELEFAAYRKEDAGLEWISARLEPDPEDEMDKRRLDLENWDGRCPASKWADKSFWDRLKDGLASTHAPYASALENIFRWTAERINPPEGKKEAPGHWGFASPFGRSVHHPECILALLAEYRIRGRKGAMDEILASVDAATALPHWGNPREGAYGCDGDMAAASMLRDLSMAYHYLRDFIGDERRERLKEKLRLQGDRFFNLMLLHRDYWGGSLIQDHGRQSIAAFAVAAIHLLGEIAAAARWVSYIIPRARRSLDAGTVDGYIPVSSYNSPFLYLYDMAFYREALLALSGEDIYDLPQFRAVNEYLVSHVMADPARRAPIVMGISHYLNAAAVKFGDGRMAWLQAKHLEIMIDQFRHAMQERAFFNGALLGLLTFDPSVNPVEPDIGGNGPLRHYPDSGAVQYRDKALDLDFSLQCGPWCGYNAYRKATGPCDRMEVMLGKGHFTIALHGRPLILAAETGYRLSWQARNVMLVDEKGPAGDIGYPMSIPSYFYRGESIESADWNPETKTGRIRLNLQPAYPEETGMAAYTREFILLPGQSVLIRDHAVFAAPRRLSWHFNGFRGEVLPGKAGLSCVFDGEEGRLNLEAKPLNFEIGLSIDPTEVVYSYSSAYGYRPFDHARFGTKGPVVCASVEFQVSAI